MFGHGRPSPPIHERTWFKISCRADEGFSLTVRDNAVVLAGANPGDEHQHWYKDTRHSGSVKDEEGHPAFALVNKATGSAIKHSLGQSHPVELVPYSQEYKNASLMWTESKEVAKGYRCIRMANNIGLNFDAFHGDKDHGGVRDGTILVLWEWCKGKNQSWKIQPLGREADAPPPACGLQGAPPGHENLQGVWERHYVYGSKTEHEFFGLPVMPVEFLELFQLYDQLAFDKQLMTAYCLLKIVECKKLGIFDVGFISPDAVNEWTVRNSIKETEENLLKSFLIHQNKTEILFPYNFNYHFILLSIKLDMALVTVLDSRRKDPENYADMTAMPKKVWKKFTRKVPGLNKELRFTHPKCLYQKEGTSLCAYYVCEFIRHSTSERGFSDKQFEIWQMQDELLPHDRIRAIQEELAGFFLDHVIPKDGEYHANL